VLGPGPGTGGLSDPAALIARFQVDKLSGPHLANLEKWMSAVGPYIDVVLFGDDLGGQQGSLISPEAYRELYKPFHRKLWGRAKELADVKVQLHCCGGIYEHHIDPAFISKALGKEIVLQGDA